MQSLRISVVMAVMLLGSVVLRAQVSVDAMVKEWERAKAYTKEYLEAMPADKYGMKPTADMRSFAGQMMHMTVSQAR